MKYLVKTYLGEPRLQEVPDYYVGGWPTIAEAKRCYIGGRKVFRADCLRVINEELNKVGRTNLKIKQAEALTESDIKR